MRGLIAEAPKEVLEFLVGVALNLVFLGLAALALWPVGAAALASRLAKGYLVLWALLALASVVEAVGQRAFRVDEYTSLKAYALPGVLVGVLLLGGWSAFAALAAGGAAAGAVWWAAGVVYFVGLLSSVAGFFVASAFYQGQLYRLFNLPAAVVSFALFALWPAAARTLYGWFFALF